MIFRFPDEDDVSHVDVLCGALNVLESFMDSLDNVRLLAPIYMYIIYFLHCTVFNSIQCLHSRILHPHKVVIHF